MTSIKTPYTKSVVIMNESGCSPEPKYNYYPYDIFVMRTRILPFIKELLGENYDIKTDYIDEENQTRVVIEPVLGTRVIKLPKTLKDKIEEKLKEEIDDKNKNNALIFNTFVYLQDETNKHIPKKWVEQMIKFIDVIPKHITPYVDNNSIYVNMSEYENYNEVYEELQEKIYKQLKEFYSNGYITDAESIENDWDLEKVIGEYYIEGKYPIPTLFRPAWKDNRFAPDLVNFLYDRLSGKQLIKVDIGSSNVVRHDIARNLNSFKTPYYFNDETIMIRLQNRVQAEGIVNLIYDIKSKAFGSVFVMTADRVSYIKIYQYIASTSFENNECTQYLRKDLFPQLIFSCRIKDSENPHFFVEQFKKRTVRVLLNSEKTKKKNINVHEAIEENGYKF